MQRYKHDILMSLPGSAHIPRNCEHSTMDRGNLKANQNKSEHSDACFTLLDTNITFITHFL